MTAVFLWCNSDVLRGMWFPYRVLGKSLQLPGSTKCLSGGADRSTLGAGPNTLGAHDPT